MNLRRIFNKNLRKIIIGIVTVIFIIALIQLFNDNAKESNNSTDYDINKGQAYSILSNTIMETKTNEKNTELISKFIEYCNKGKTENAYNLLADESKEVYYPTINEFINNYYNKVFNQSKTYSAQSWITSNGNYTYKVKILNDMMSTGKYNSEDFIEDYYTIVNNEKLNINKYIKREEINTTSENNNVIFTVEYKDVYLEYEKYCIKIENNNDYNIAIDSKQTTKGMYLLGENKTKYSSYIHELTIEDLIVESNRSKELNVKFNKSYNPDVKIKNIVISDIILNYDENQSLLEDSPNKTSIMIKLIGRRKLNGYKRCNKKCSKKFCQINRI